MHQNIFQIKVLKYIRLHTKIFQIVFQNILECVQKYFSKKLGTKKTFSNND